MLVGGQLTSSTGQLPAERASLEIGWGLGGSERGILSHLPLVWGPLVFAAFALVDCLWLGFVLGVMVSGTWFCMGRLYVMHASAPLM